MKVLDLFSGIGGFSLGLGRVGMQTVAFCESDPYPRLVLKKHWPSVPIHNDVCTLTSKDLGNETIDLVCGGFPCQDISVSGTGKGLSGNRSGLWYQFERLIAETNCKFAIIENSPFLRSRGLDQVLQGLWQIGYDAEWHIIPASAFGAPHRRERLWVIAYSRSIGFKGSWQCISSMCSAKDSFREADRLVSAVHQGQLPFMCGGHDGFPYRVDRPAIKALGNAVVPQIVEYIGNYIINGEWQ